MYIHFCLRIHGGKSSDPRGRQARVGPGSPETLCPARCWKRTTPKDLPNDHHPTGPEGWLVPELSFSAED